MFYFIIRAIMELSSECDIKLKNKQSFIIYSLSCHTKPVWDLSQNIFFCISSEKDSLTGLQQTKNVYFWLNRLFNLLFWEILDEWLHSTSGEQITNTGLKSFVFCCVGLLIRLHLPTEYCVTDYIPQCNVPDHFWPFLWSVKLQFWFYIWMYWVMWQEHSQ